MKQNLDSSGSSQPSTGTSPSLLERVKADDHHAWDRLVGLYAPLVLYWCRRAGVAEEDIDDVFQEVFLAVATHIGSFKKERPSDTFRGWLRTITRSKVIDQFRRRGKDPQVLGSAAAMLADVVESEASASERGPDHVIERALFRRGLELIKGEFEDRTWQAFWRTTVEGRAPRDVADELGMSSGAVRVAKCRVLHRLRQELGDLME